MTPKQVVAHFGTQSKAARELGIDRSTMCNYLKDGWIPKGRQALVQLLTRGKLKLGK